MNYEEAWDVAYSIGYHAGREPESFEADRQVMWDMQHRWSKWAYMIRKRFDEGRKDGEEMRSGWIVVEAYSHGGELHTMQERGAYEARYVVLDAETHEERKLHLFTGETAAMDANRAYMDGIMPLIYGITT